MVESLDGDSELKELSARLSEFNILQVLRIEEAEIRHRNILGWLLNPRESHSLNDTFVRRFISTLLMDNEQAGFGLSPAEIELMDLVDTEVRREWRNIDLLVHSNANQLIILIENKIRSKESKGQLLRYREIVRQSFPDTKVTIPILLTLEGDHPSEEAQGMDYISWSHVALYKVASEVIEQQQNRIPQDAQIFLHHYLKTLRRITMQDKELEELCKSIYRKHRAAINLVVQYSAATVFVEATEDFINEHPDIELIKSRPEELWFIPKEWTNVMPRKIECGLSRYPVIVWFDLDKEGQKVRIILSIELPAGTERQRNLAEAFRQGGFKVGKNADRQKTARVYSDTHRVLDLSDSDEVKQTIEALWQQSQDEVARATKVIRDFAWEE